MLKNMLVGVDGGPSGRDAIALANRLTDPNRSASAGCIGRNPRSQP
jgi:hypothetical protein